MSVLRVRDSWCHFCTQVKPLVATSPNRISICASCLKLARDVARGDK